MSKTVPEITFQQDIIYQCLLFLDPVLRSETSKRGRKTERGKQIQLYMTSWFTMETRTAKNTHVHRHIHTLCLINTSFKKSKDYTTQQ